MHDEKNNNNSEVDTVDDNGTESVTESAGNVGASVDADVLEDVSKKEEKTFTQAQVSRMMAKEKRQGAASVYRELGIDPRDAKAVAMVKALIASQKTDDQKEAEKRAAEDEKERETERRVLVAETKAEAMVLGIKREFVDDMVALVMSKLTEDSDVKTLLGEYKKKYPAWFNDADGDDDAAGKRGTGTSIKSESFGKSGSNRDSGIGARLAAQRKAVSSKRTYWGGGM